MQRLRFRKELYPKIALLKSCYNFTDRAYLHLDADSDYYYVDMAEKSDVALPTCHEFENEVLAQSVRHEIVNATKSIRKLILARALATTVVSEADECDPMDGETINDRFTDEEILKDWFSSNE